jgi:hypothetical protein
MADLNTLLGMGLGNEEQMRLTADALRRQDSTGRQMSLSSVDNIAKLGQQASSNALGSAKQGGTLKQAMLAAKAKKRAVADKVTTDAGVARALAKTNKLEATQAYNRETRPYVEYYDPNDPTSTKRQFNMEGNTVREWVDGKLVESSVEGLEKWSDSLAAKAARGGSGSYKRPKYNQSKELVNSETGEVIWAFEDSNPDTSGWFTRTMVDGKPTLQDVDMSKYQPISNVTDTDRKRFSETRANINKLAEITSNIPDTAFQKAGDLPFEARITNYVASKFPWIAGSKYATQEGAEWWRNKAFAVDMEARHKMFGGALTQTEVQTWVDANISADNTLPQALRSLQSMVASKAKNFQGEIGAATAKGAPKRQTDSWARPDLVQQIIDKVDARNKILTELKVDVLEVEGEKFSKKRLAEALATGRFGNTEAEVIMNLRRAKILEQQEINSGN